MIKIKLVVIAVFLSLAALALINSQTSVTSANEDVLQEIAGYKTWQRINREPIKVASQFQADDIVSDENIFIIDGQELTNFRTGDLGG